jgi:phosphate/sulfate permease
LLGSKVSGTIRKNIIDITFFSDGGEKELMLGYVSALSGCCIWLIIATILNLPVSGTHSIVGATLGMAIVSKGLKVIQWKEILKIGEWRRQSVRGVGKRSADIGNRVIVIVFTYCNYYYNYFDDEN